MSNLADNIWKKVRGYVDPYSRQEAAQAVIEVLGDCDESHQLHKDATAVEIEDDWAPDYDFYDDDEYWDIAYESY